jgi:hypothetical protein
MEFVMRLSVYFTACCILLTSCSEIQSPQPKQVEKPLAVRIIMIENRTRTQVKSVLVTSAYTDKYGKMKNLYEKVIFLDTASTQVLYILNVEVCMLIVRVSYIDGIDQVSKKQDFCQTPTWVLHEKERKSKLAVTRRFAIG